MATSNSKYLASAVREDRRGHSPTSRSSVASTERGLDANVIHTKIRSRGAELATTSQNKRFSSRYRMKVK